MGVEEKLFPGSPFFRPARSTNRVIEPCPQSAPSNLRLMIALPIDMDPKREVQEI